MKDFFLHTIAQPNVSNSWSGGWFDMKKFLMLAMVVLAVTISSITRAEQASPNQVEQASATHVPLFTISGGSAGTLMSTGGIPTGTTGYSDALLKISHTRAYRFEFLGCGDAAFDNRFYLLGSGGHLQHFDCKTSKIGDHFIANLKIGKVGPHWPFHFQAAADMGGPSVFNGEGPFNGVYTNNDFFSNTSIFYAIEGSTANPGATSGDVVLLGFSDGGVLNDIDHQDLVVRISKP
jgi:hypothetical protein